MSGLQILHLEDDTLDAELVHREVARLDFQPQWVTVSSSEQFFDAIENTHFDAILSDNRVPGIEGLQALEVARQRRPGMPFIFVSGNTDPRWAEHCLEAGATDYVPKDQLFRLPSALRRLHDAREAERLAALTRGRALLVDLVKELSLARSADAVVRILLRGARELNQADGAAIVMREGDFCHYVDEDAIGPLWKGSRLPLDACISGWAMLNRQPVSIPDVCQDPRIPHDAYRSTFVKSLVMVPIRAEAPIGAIGNYWANAHEATPDEVQLIQSLADCSSLAFENVAVYEDLERRLQQRTAELKEASGELEAISHAVSHDLRAPLRAVQGYSEMLLADTVPPLQGQPLLFAQNILAAAQRMNTLIEDLLGLSKVTRAQVRVQSVHIGAMARDILNTLQAAWPQRSARVEIDASLVADGDAGLLRLALENLLSNAWKFTSKRADAMVSFSAEPHKDGRLVYCVRDNGAGFDMAYVQQLFEPFRRLHRESEFPGTGVGLAIVRRVIQKHGGEIWVAAEKDKGASFFFTLPARGAAR